MLRLSPEFLKYFLMGSEYFLRSLIPRLFNQLFFESCSPNKLEAITDLVVLMMTDFRWGNNLQASKHLPMFTFIVIDGCKILIFFGEVIQQF